MDFRNSPLEGKIEENQKDSSRIPGLVVGAGVLRDAASQTAGGN